MRQQVRPARAWILVAAVMSAQLSPALSARADDQGWVFNGYLTAEEANYLARLRQERVFIPLPAGAVVHDGQMICDSLHRGLSPEDTAYRYLPSSHLPQVIAAAQAELCPDTLGRGAA
ncbi:DUF732 domain-containing protein [Mycolicibacter sinensis]